MRADTELLCSWFCSGAGLPPTSVTEAVISVLEQTIRGEPHAASANALAHEKQQIAGKLAERSARAPVPMCRYYFGRFLLHNSPL